MQWRGSRARIMSSSTGAIQKSRLLIQRVAMGAPLQNTQAMENTVLSMAPRSAIRQVRRSTGANWHPPPNRPDSSFQINDLQL
jgi:hypothetical protein